MVGGPAYNTKALKKGDVILEVDATPVDVERLHQALIGCDLPGSTVTLRVRKAGTREIVDVEIVRVESRELADKRRLMELFTAIENHIDEPVQDRLVGVKMVDNAIELWTKMQVHP